MVTDSIIWYSAHSLDCLKDCRIMVYIHSSTGLSRRRNFCISASSTHEAAAAASSSCTVQDSMANLLHLVGGKLAGPLPCRTKGYEMTARAKNTNERVSLTCGPPAGYIYPAAAAGLPSPPPNPSNPLRSKVYPQDIQSEAPPDPTSASCSRRNPETEEFAVAVLGAFPERQLRGNPNQWAYWRGGNQNGSGPAAQTRFERDSATIQRLLDSGRVHARELCSYRSPQVILDQGPQIDPVIAQILDMINNAACSRRLVLDYKVKGKSNAAELKEHQRKLALFPGQIYQLQGHIEALGGRILRIPPLLLTPAELLP